VGAEIETRLQTGKTRDLASIPGRGRRIFFYIKRQYMNWYTLRHLFSEKKALFLRG
jgi:hypothetical protein